MKLADKKALIVGGADAIGRGIALRFAKEGARIAVIDADKAEGEKTATLIRDGGGSCYFVAADVSTREAAAAATREAVARLGGVHILVNNTLQACEMGPLEDKTSEVVSAGMKGLQAALWMMQAVFPRMRDQKWGRIINVGSRYGERMNVYAAEYNMAAWGLRSLTRTAAAEWFNFNIVSNLLETAADTPEFQAYRAENVEAVDALVDQVALARRGDPENDIGAAASIMACDEVDWINGQVFYADGGQHLAPPAFIPAVHRGFLLAKSEAIYKYQ